MVHLKIKEITLKVISWNIKKKFKVWFILCVCVSRSVVSDSMRPHGL